MRLLASAAALALVVTGAPAAAADLSLSPGAIAAAVTAGRANAAQGGGYAIAPYLLYSVPDAEKISDENANVEAVELGTPYERLRWEAYREQMMRTPFDARDVQEYVRQHAGRVEFVVYTHSRTEKDRNFLQRFAGGQLVRADGNVVADAQLARSVTIVDTYSTPSGAMTQRYMGQVTYRFALADVPQADLAQPLTFVFLDDAGAAHRIPLTLADYR